MASKVGWDSLAKIQFGRIHSGGFRHTHFPGMQTIPVNDSIPKTVNDFNDSFHAALEDSIMS